tara:strand:+ start:295 stop:489 length:195 start_codon:yes stop_codon:yes gene_type:complete
MSAGKHHFRHLWATLVVVITLIRARGMHAIAVWWTWQLIKADRAHDRAIIAEVDTRRQCKEVVS